MLNCQVLTLELDSVVVFKNEIRFGVSAYLHRYLRLCRDHQDADQTVAAYCDFVSALYEHGCDYGAYLLRALAEDENLYVKTLAAGEKISPHLAACFMRELKLFSALSGISPAQLQHIGPKIPPEVGLPAFSSTEMDFTTQIPAALKEVEQKGYGMFARYGMFRVDEQGALCPVLSPDPVRLSGLVGYEDERRRVLENTQALLAGKPAANALLCGDAGTGKSATVKAVANELFDRGVRLIEIGKEQLFRLPAIMGQIARNPLKFIIFIDDLSFSEQDDSFGALKAVLEGSAATKTSNAVIYATSNRRHMVRESFSAREGDEIHRNDAMQEMISLSARFGLRVLFVKPDKKLFAEIVLALAHARGITMQEETLLTKAEAFALNRGGRSARVAQQFIDNLSISEGNE